MAVAGREKTADVEWPELAWYTEKGKEDPLLVWNLACEGNDSKDGEFSSGKWCWKSLETLVDYHPGMKLM